MRNSYKLLLLLLAFHGLGRAQLSVSPSASSDSYIFVDNTVIYVQDGITLTKNRNPETEASIYLRNEAQLFQGEKTSSMNSGNGAISVYQEGTANAYDYNYWSLPVSRSGSQKNVSDFLFEPRSILNSTTVGLTYELEGRNNPLVISKRWIYKFTGVEYSDWKHVGEYFDLKPGEGYTMKGVGVQNNAGNQRYDFRGIPNDGEYSLNINQGQFLLVGNPYPSAFDLRSFLQNNPTSTGIAYFWESRSNGSSHYLKDYEGGYGQYSPGANNYNPAIFKKYTGGGEAMGETGGRGEDMNRQFIPIGQGFMVEGKQNGRITFRNSYRTFKKESQNETRFKSSNTVLQKLEDTAKIPCLRLAVEFNDTYIRPLLLAFRDDSTTGNDWAMDAIAYGSSASDAGWLIENSFYLVNVRPYVDEEKIPMIVKMDTPGEIVFNLESVSDLNPETVIIYDAEIDQYKNIIKGDYKVSLDKGEYGSRFFLGLKMQSEKPEDPDSPDPEEEDDPIVETPIDNFRDELMAFQNQRENIIQIKIPTDVQAKQVSLFDIRGSKITSKTVSSTDKEFDLPAYGLTEGVYILNIITTENKRLTKKITLKKGS